MNLDKVEEIAVRINGAALLLDAAKDYIIARCPRDGVKANVEDLLIAIEDILFEARDQAKKCADDCFNELREKNG